MSEPTASLPDDPSAPKAMLAAERTENERLRQIIKELQRHRFGRRAESLPEDQLLLALEDAEQVEAQGFAAEDAADPAKSEARARKRRANRGSLPAHLPRIEQVIDIPEKTCPCCHGLALGDGNVDLAAHSGKAAAAGRPDITLQPNQFLHLCTRDTGIAAHASELADHGFKAELRYGQLP